MEIRRARPGDRSPIQMISGEMLDSYRRIEMLYCEFIQYCDIPLKRPLTTAELREIKQRRDPADINRLLWEIRRLRIIALRADQFVSLSSDASGTQA
jgi:hypothetical protein